jgi:hypothetical protein
MAKLKAAMDILMAALPQFPTGSDPWKAVNSAISGLGKHAQPGASAPGVMQTELRDLQQGAGKNAALEAVMRSLGSPQGGAGSAPGGPGGGPMAAGASPPML